MSSIKPETSVMGVIFHAFKWLFVRVAPFILIGAIAGFTKMYEIIRLRSFRQSFIKQNKKHIDSI